MRFAPVVVRGIHCMGDASKLATAIDLQCYDFLSERRFRSGLESGSLGLGPGPHLERPNVVHRNTLPQPFEAHSTLLD
ncbi:MAG: hypothetical protein WCB23_02125, partial [Pseudolabrys sp.]